MSTKSHNKKRNVGLVYELLLKEIAKSTIENNNNSNKAIKLLKKHFSTGSEIYKEFRLINSLATTKIINHTIIPSIISEAKKACRQINIKILEEEKTKLIHDINKIFGETFFDSHLKEYRTYATIQVLFNNWRSQNPDIGILAKYEELLAENLQKPNNLINNDGIGNNIDGINKRLMLKLMTKKLNEKYSGQFSQKQKDLIKEYVFQKQANNSFEFKEFSNKLNSLVENIINDIEHYCKSNNISEFINKKLIKCKFLLESEFKNTNEIVNDSKISKALALIKLQEEINSKD